MKNLIHILILLSSLYVCSCYAFADEKISIKVTNELKGKDIQLQMDGLSCTEQEFGSQTLPGGQSKTVTFMANSNPWPSKCSIDPASADIQILLDKRYIFNYRLTCKGSHNNQCEWERGDSGKDKIIISNSTDAKIIEIYVTRGRSSNNQVEINVSQRCLLGTSCDWNKSFSY